MAARQRVAEHLNGALGAALAADDRLYLLGQDITDPYGGAFKITRGLSTRFPRQVVATPISEAGLVGLANGLALAGNRAIVEMMFADFVTLAFDQIVNFAAKSVSMYGQRVPMPVVVRCPTGGRRGYGPTHSQSLQKHFLGVPDLDVYEISPFHDCVDLFAGVLRRGVPAVVFEDKVLYTGLRRPPGTADDLFRYDLAGPWPGTAVARIAGIDTPDCVLITPGGVAERALVAMRELLISREISCELYVPARLDATALEPILPAAARAGQVVIVEDGTAGGTWAADLAHQLHTALWGQLSRPVRVVCAADRVVPAAAHLEEEVLVQAATISATVQRGHR
ncbi:alpha-ketoacid dehydrogenase subunit beta [Cryptosporangium arvum]|uniref:Pyruvate dehydrogenase E1 component subunit beta n=1 Tax=Cryptosporangium arvum DSM 44712 TaxID=927661 RepID=A0A010YRA7_9ACTN|nr:transketolase C-terminal domain-containing protein [Cryptosporangium arvum]EXG82725.1 pyruvate/2-oxoglutarate dehydrogenase complex, dehydrogenase component beta subunit [Cryptosporangium arvum DSM 44712]